LQSIPEIAERTPHANRPEGIDEERGRRRLSSKFGTMVWDGRVPGFGVRCFPLKRQYVFRYRTKEGVQRTVNIGVHGALTVERARDRALDLYEAVRKGEDPVAAEEAQAKARANRRTVGEVLDSFTLRSAAEYHATFNRLVRPRIGEVDIGLLRRSHLTMMLDHIEDHHGATMADRALQYTRSALNWHATRDDDFISPVAKGMMRTKAREQARTRILDDEELCAVWPALEEASLFGAFVKLLLLTGQRRAELAGLRRSEIRAGLWLIPAERYKTARPQSVPLSAAAQAIIAALPKGDPIFPVSFIDSGKPKARLDKAVTARQGGRPLDAWTLHDLRRTARSLMSRAGIRPDIAERCLGHVVGGVEGTYDRHHYIEEKRAAFGALAAIVERIVGPPAGANVIALRQEAV
jgi:integrase